MSSCFRFFTLSRDIHVPVNSIRLITGHFVHWHLLSADHWQVGIFAFSLVGLLLLIFLRDSGLPPQRSALIHHALRLRLIIPRLPRPSRATVIGSGIS